MKDFKTEPKKVLVVGELRKTQSDWFIQTNDRVVKCGLWIPVKSLGGIGISNCHSWSGMVLGYAMYCNND